METAQGHKNTGAKLGESRLQLWLAPYREQCVSAFDALVAAYEDDQLVDEFSVVGAHLLVALGAALGREKEIHPGILELTRKRPENVKVETTHTSWLYLFTGSTPADEPDPNEWELASVRTEGRGSMFNGESLWVKRTPEPTGDKRFTIYTGATTALPAGPSPHTQEVASNG